MKEEIIGQHFLHYVNFKTEIKEILPIKDEVYWILIKKINNKLRIEIYCMDKEIVINRVFGESFSEKKRITPLWLYRLYLNLKHFLTPRFVLRNKFIKETKFMYKILAWLCEGTEFGKEAKTICECMASVEDRNSKFYNLLSVTISIYDLCYSFGDKIEAERIWKEVYCKNYSSIEEKKKALKELEAQKIKEWVNIK